MRVIILPGCNQRKMRALVFLFSLGRLVFAAALCGLRAPIAAIEYKSEMATGAIIEEEEISEIGMVGGCGDLPPRSGRPGSCREENSPAKARRYEIA